MHTSLLFILFLSFLNLSLAEDIILGTSNAPPYMIQESHRGIDIDIAKKVLERLGHNVSIKYYSLSRAKYELEMGRLDAMVPLFKSAGSERIFVSNPHVMYRPTAFSLKSNKVRVSSIKDLSKYKIMTFQGAVGYFGYEFLQVSKTALAYKEYFDMSKLVKMLFLNRADVMVLDYNIFHYYRRKLKLPNRSEPVVTHAIFPKVPAVVGFKNQKLRDSFNLELVKFYRDGSQEKIIQKYIK